MSKQLFINLKNYYLKRFNNLGGSNKFSVSPDVGSDGAHVEEKSIEIINVDNEEEKKIITYSPFKRRGKVRYIIQKILDEFELSSKEDFVLFEDSNMAKDGVGIHPSTKLNDLKQLYIRYTKPVTIKLPSSENIKPNFDIPISKLSYKSLTFTVYLILPTTLTYKKKLNKYNIDTIDLSKATYSSKDCDKCIQFDITIGTYERKINVGNINETLKLLEKNIPKDSEDNKFFKSGVKYVIEDENLNFENSFDKITIDPKLCIKATFGPRGYTSVLKIIVPKINIKNIMQLQKG